MRERRHTVVARLRLGHAQALPELFTPQGRNLLEGLREVIDRHGAELGLSRDKPPDGLMAHLRNWCLAHPHLAGGVQWPGRSGRKRLPGPSRLFDKEGLGMLFDLTIFVRDLSWPPALLNDCRSWLGAYRDFLDQQFRKYCGRDRKLGWLLSAFLGLPEGARKDFLFSPGVSSQLFSRDANHTPVFSVLATEFVRVLSRSTDCPDPEPELDKMLLPFGTDHGDVQGIPLDFDSALPFPSRGAEGGELHALQPDRVHQVKRHLEATLEALKQGNPVARECVRLLTLRLAVREEVACPGRFTSGSFGKYIGLTLLTNPWVDRADTAKLANSLVHEAIHSALYVHETLEGPLVLDKKAADDFPICSPWSGRTLNGNQYVQACFVWFGLSQLWRTWPEGAGGVSSQRIHEMYRRASQGFQSRPVKSLMSHPSWGLVSPAAQDALRFMEECSLGAFCPGPANR